jgi:hypothetical protein
MVIKQWVAQKNQGMKRIGSGSSTSVLSPLCLWQKGVMRLACYPRAGIQTAF